MEKRHEKTAKQEEKAEEKKKTLPVTPKEKETKHSPFCSSKWSDVCNCGVK